MKKEKTRKPKILFIAYADSIHTARWINQIADLGWDLHLFPSTDCCTSRTDFRNITIHYSFYGRRLKFTHPTQKIKGIPVFFGIIANLIRYIIRTRIFPEYRSWYLSYLIRKIKPDIIHSMEFQHACYLTLEAKKMFKGKFPTWIVTNWGSDIYYYGQFSKHEKKIRQILKECDYYSCECQRDVCIAKNYGLKGKVLPVLPNSGGFNFKKIKRYYRKNKPSKRRLILLKGYQGLFGRAFVGLRALERCADLLKGYKVIIFATYKDSDVSFAAKIFTNRTGIPTESLSWISHAEILKLQNKARIYIGLSISDAISTSLLESMVMGSFPIQSNTSCADEWIENNKTGMIVPAEDPEIITDAIRKALTDDVLVDRAADLNWQFAQDYLDEEILKKKTIDFYLEASGKKKK